MYMHACQNFQVIWIKGRKKKSSELIKNLKVAIKAPSVEKPASLFTVKVVPIGSQEKKVVGNCIHKVYSTS